MNELIIIDTPSFKVSKVLDKYRIKKLISGSVGVNGTWHVLWFSELEMLDLVAAVNKGETNEKI